MEQLTTVKLYNVPFTRNGSNKCCFSSISSFESALTNVASFSNATFVRDGIIEVPTGAANIDATANYVSYVNKKVDGTNGHRFFGYIDSVDYLSPTVARIYYTVDGFHSFINNATFPNQMIERTNADVVEKDTINEFTPSTRVVFNQISQFFDEWYILFYMNIRGRFPDAHKVYSTIYQSTFILIAKNDSQYTDTLDFIDSIWTTNEDIVNVVAFPKALFPSGVTIQDLTIGTKTVHVITSASGAPASTSINIESLFDGIDNRLLHYPTSILRVRLGDNSVELPIESTINENGLSRVVDVAVGFSPYPFAIVGIPAYCWEGESTLYKNQRPAISMTNFPSVPITYRNWGDFLTSAGTSSISTLTSMLKSISAENYIGGIASGGSYLADVGLKAIQTALNPTIRSGSVEALQAAGWSGLFIELLVPTRKEAEQFFAVWNNFGYPIKRIDAVAPVFAGMNFCYWKLTDAQVNGQMPEYAREEIRNAFNSGVRVWSTFTNFGKMV